MLRAPRDKRSRSRSVSGVLAGPFAQVVQGPEGPVAQGPERAQAELGYQAVQRGRGAGFGERVELAHLLAKVGERGVVLGERARASGSVKAVKELEKARPPPYSLARTWLVKQRWSFETDPELRAWGRKSLPMVLTAPHRSLWDVWLFNTAFTY
jgi:hypothetical protein